MRSNRARFLRFLVAGGTNTAITFVLYLGLLRVLDYTWSYVLAFVAGVVLAYLMQRYLVFGASGGRFGWLFLSFSYVFQLGLGVFLVRAWVQTLHAPEALAPLFSAAVTVPLMFVISRQIFRGKAEEPS